MMYGCSKRTKAELIGNEDIIRAASSVITEV